MELGLGGTRVVSDADSAQSLPLLDTPRPWGALMPSRASNTVRYLSAQPMRFEHYATKISDALAEVFPCRVGVASATHATDPVRARHMARGCRGVVPSRAVNAVGGCGSKVGRFKQHRASVAELGPKLSFGHGGIVPDARLAYPVPLSDGCWGWRAVMSGLAQDSVRGEATQPFEVEEGRTELIQPGAERFERLRCPGFARSLARACPADPKPLVELRRAR